MRMDAHGRKNLADEARMTNCFTRLIVVAAATCYHTSTCTRVFLSSCNCSCPKPFRSVCEQIEYCTLYLYNTSRAKTFTMMFSSKVVVSFLAFAAFANARFFVREDEVTAGMDPSCPTVRHYTAPYHEDSACDRAQHNQYKQTLDQRGIYNRLQVVGPDRVPSQHTGFCPQTVTALTNKEAQTGFNTVWIVENTASTPVVLGYMMEQADGTYKEVSAFDSNISPPNHDPKAILQPEEWKSVSTTEGHVFHVREINKDGSMGQVVMQHRVGLIPITNKYGHELHCDPNEPDVEPVVEAEPGVVDRDPNFAREAPRYVVPCNALDIGFRNQVGCPLNAYYTGMYAMKGAAKPRGNNLPFNSGDYAKGEGLTSKSCHEVFKFVSPLCGKQVLS
jgi:hypothetical protein